jgi:hypothetical protein
VKIVKAAKLPASDKLKGLATSDSFFVLNVANQDETKVWRQQTTVKTKCLDPFYDEYFEIPLAAKPDLFEAMLKSVSPEMLQKSPGQFIVPESTAVVARRSKSKLMDEESCFVVWEDMLDAASTNVATLEPYFTGEEDPDGTETQAHVQSEATPKLLEALSHSSGVEELKGSRQVARTSVVIPSLQADAVVLPVEDAKLPFPFTGSSPQIQDDIVLPAMRSSGEGEYSLEAAGRVKEPSSCSDNCQACKCM